MTDVLKNAAPVMPGMWRETEDGEIVLLGSRCDSCGEVYFPRKEVPICAHCQSEMLSDIELSRNGVIHSVTHVLQKPAGGYYYGPVPFLCAIVEFPEGVYVMGHVLSDDPDAVQIGDPVHVVLDVLFEKGDEVISTYKFKKIAGRDRK